MDNIKIPKGIKIFSTVLFIGSLLLILWPMKFIEVPVNFKGVAVDAPYFFGSSGVRKEAKPTGRYLEWSTTKYVMAPDTPIRQAVSIDDLTTADNNRADFQAAVTYSIVDHSDLVSKFTLSFWSRSVEAEFIAITRELVKPHSLAVLMNNTVVLGEIDRQITERLVKFLNERGIKVQIHGVALGQARPNKAVAEQIEETARVEEANRTMDKRITLETKRIQEEKERAKADNAYREGMGLTSLEFQRITLAKIQAEACAAAVQCYIGIDRIVNTK